MTLKELYETMEAKNAKPLSSAEKHLLNSTFGDDNVINAIIYAPKEYILTFLDEANGYIIHESGIINKIAPIGNETYFGIYKENHGFLIAKSIT